MGNEYKGSEKILLIVLFVVIIGSIYFLAVDRPVRQGIKEADERIEVLSAKYDEIVVRIQEINKMKEEMNKMDSDSVVSSMMPSYNSGNQELEFLNTTLSDALDYYVGFSRVTRDGDQIRRGFTLQYKAKDYDAAEKILADLESSPIRCVIGNVSISPVKGTSVKHTQVQISADATFFETMYGGTPDSELPEDQSTDSTTDEKGDVLG